MQELEISFFLSVLRIRIRNWIRSDPVFLGHPDSDPGKYRIRLRILYPQKTTVIQISHDPIFLGHTDRIRIF